MKKYQTTELNFNTQIIWQKPSYFLAFGFGTGTIPIAPGTFGTLMAIPFYLLISSWPLWLYISFLVLFTLIAARLCHQLSIEINMHDCQGMNLDEFVGFGYTMLLAGNTFEWIFAGFVLFRFFDILKPFPLSWVDEHIKGGFGMVLDDILAGLFATAILGFCRYFL